MEPYCLKDKILITKEFLTDLENKGWQEIETLQNQIANIETNFENTDVIQLLKNLLTSYYVFVGSLENLSCKNTDFTDKEVEIPLDSAEADMSDDEEYAFEVAKKPPVKTHPERFFKPDASEPFEPFEYFIDFDEPSGEPLSDEDLYGTI